MRQGARGWCTGMTQRDGMGWRWEGGSGWRTHVHPWLIHVKCMAKPLQYCKVISLQLKQINLKQTKRSQARKKEESSKTEKVLFTHSVMSNSLCPMDCSLSGFSIHGDSPGKNTRVGGYGLPQGIFPMSDQA